MRRSAESHNEYQRQYFSKPERKTRLWPAQDHGTLRHLEAAIGALELEPGAKILELGCGMGRFSLLLAELGFEVTAVDLSPELLTAFTSQPGAANIRTVCCEAEEVSRHVTGPFDAVVGFFFLHHLNSLEPALREARSMLAPHGKVAFCEPNAFNPFFYLQILLTPTMNWEGDGGVARMRPNILLPAFRDVGLKHATIERYGMLPPVLANADFGRRLENRLQRWRCLKPVLAFQIVCGEATA